MTFVESIRQRQTKIVIFLEKQQFFDEGKSKIHINSEYFLHTQINNDERRITTACNADQSDRKRWTGIKGYFFNA